MALVGGLVIAVPATSASASATCYGYSCHGHDPYVYGCTISSQKFAYYYSGRTLMATLTNDYSYKCNANWSQSQLSQYAVNLGWNFAVITTTTDSHGSYESMCWSGPDSPNNTGHLQEACIPSTPPFYNGTGPAWTDMVDGTNLTYSAMDVDDAHGNRLQTLTVDQ